MSLETVVKADVAKIEAEAHTIIDDFKTKIEELFGKHPALDEHVDVAKADVSAAIAAATPEPAPAEATAAVTAEAADPNRSKQGPNSP